MRILLRQGRTRLRRTSPGRTIPRRTSPGRTSPGRTSPGRTSPGRTSPGKPKQWRTIFGAAAVAALMLAVTPALADDDVVTVFAAASLTDALEEIGARYRQEDRGAVQFSFASSSTLARQIEAGAPADIFAAANEQWMDYLAEHGLIDPATRTSPIGNGLVLIAPADSPLGPVAIGPGQDLPGLLGPDGRLAVGDPDHVPAGIYAKQALQSLGWWDGLEPRLARTDHVRAALALVERGEAPLGIVYATDAAVSDGVKVVGRFPPTGHNPITYPFAVVAGRSSPAVQRFFTYLISTPSLGVFETYGFLRN